MSLVISLGDFSANNFSPAKYIQQFTQDQHSQIIKQLQFQIQNQRKQIDTNYKPVFEKFCQSYKNVQLTNTYVQLLNDYQHETQNNYQEQINIFNNYQTKQFELNQQLQIQQHQKELIIFQIDLYNKLENKQNQLPLAELLAIQKNPFYKECHVEIKEQFQQLLQQNLSSTYQNLNLLQCELGKLKFLLQNDIQHLLECVNELFINEILKNLLSKYQISSQQNSQIINNIVNIVNIIQNAITNLIEQSVNQNEQGSSKLSFISVFISESINQLGQCNNQPGKLYVNELLISITDHLAKQLKIHFSVFFAPKISSAINIKDGQQQQISKQQVIKLYLTTEIEASLINYCNYLSNNNIPEILNSETQFVLNQKFGVVFDLFYNYPVQNQLKQKCESQQSFGLFIPYCACQFSQQFKQILFNIIYYLKQYIDTQSYQFMKQQQDNNQKKLKFLTQLSNQKDKKSALLQSMQLFQLNIYKQTLNQMYQYFSQYMDQKIQFYNNMQQIDYIIEPQFNDMFDGFETYKVFYAVQNENINEFLTAFQQLVQDYGGV